MLSGTKKRAMTEKRRNGSGKEKRDCLDKFIRLYARFERTHNLELIPLLCHRLDRLKKVEPQFDLRRQFDIAF